MGLLQRLSQAMGRKNPQAAQQTVNAGYGIAYDPDLVPPLALMRKEGIDVLEEWFRWAEEWSMLLRVYGGITRASHVLEIGCGLGRVAFPLRYILSSEGTYDGFEIDREKVTFLQQTFQRAYPNFRFLWADVYNTYYNPTGAIQAADYRFPYADSSFDLVFAASVFTHMLPVNMAHYFCESSRVLKPGGRCVFSLFLLDNYHSGQARPLGFAREAFNFDHPYQDAGPHFAIGVPENPEEMTAYGLPLIEQFAEQAGLELAMPPAPGFWSGSHANWVGAQDVVVLAKK
jgi:SAM-dependent methyltransferase